MLSLPKLTNFDVHSQRNVYLPDRDRDSELKDAHVDLLQKLDLNTLSHQVDELEIRNTMMELPQLEAILDVVQPKGLYLMGQGKGERDWPPVLNDVPSRNYRMEFCRVFEKAKLNNLTAYADSPWFGKGAEAMRTADGVQHYRWTGGHLYAAGNHAMKACMKGLLEKIESES